MSEAIEIRTPTRDELGALHRAVVRGFHADPHEDDPFRDIVELDRARCAYSGGDIIGTLGACTLELAVPGATLPTAGTTMVTVRPTHRRRGLLRRLMRSHFEDARERGEPLAALWATEALIYSRFGYGCGADMVGVRITRENGAFARPVAASGTLRQAEDAEAEKALPPIYEGLWRTRPGQFARSPGWWKHRRLFDAPWERRGASKLRYALYEEEGEARGYVQFRVRDHWTSAGLPRHELQVVELLGRDATARAALWRFVLDVDLVGEVFAWNVPSDSELPWLLADTRQARRTPRDSLWVRLVDLPAALAGRRYGEEGALVLAVADASWPDNEDRFLLEGGPDGATCQRTTREPDVSLDAADLGAVYLGGRGLRELARAGRVRGAPEALTRADRMFGWDPAPWCQEVF